MPENGVGKFFSPTNLSRYRRLLGDKIDVDERSRVLEVLAAEWRSSTSDCHPPSAVPHAVVPREVFSNSETQGDVNSKRSS
jgi:hypothetical protein